IRVAFLVVRRDGRSVDRPSARVWLARGLRAKPFQTAAARLEPIGVPGRSRDAFGGAAEIYVAHLRTPRPGTYTLLAEPVGAKPPIQALGNVVVAARSTEPALGARAPASQTPTIASVHGDLRLLTTASPPDRSLLRWSVAGSLR